MTHVAQDIKPAEHRCSDPLAALNADLIDPASNVVSIKPSWWPKRPSALDRPLQLTFFDDHAATAKGEQTASLRQMVPAFMQHSAETKAALPWIKLARFGNTPSPKGTGSLRHDGNVVSVSGIEGDYDGGAVTVDLARDRMTAAHIAALLYTSPSHTDAAPRWRVLCPLAADLVGTSDELRERRAELVGRVNGVLGGVLSPESFTLSQSYYWGSVNSNPAHRVVLISGDAIDQRHDLPAVGVPAPKAMKEQRQDDGTVAPAVQPTGEPVPVECLRAMLACLHPGMGRQQWRDIIAALRAAPGIDEDTLRGMAVEWSRGDLHGGTVPANYTNDDAAEAVFDSMPPKEGGINVGTLIQMAREAGYTGPVTVAEGRTAEEIWQDNPHAKAEAKHDSSARTGAAGGNTRTLKLVCAVDVVPEPVRWIWNGWLARSKLHLLAGTAGDGKSTTVFNLAAILTRGGTLPDDSPVTAGSVIVWSGEDSFADTILPRFMASGGDRSKFFCIGEVQDGEAKREFDPATDVAALEDAARSVPDLALIIVDPVVMVVTGDSHKNTEVRRGLQPLVNLAQSLGVAVVGITHFRKDSGDAAVLDRVVGSMGFGAVARLVWATSKGENDGAPRVMVRAKSNIGPDGGGFYYTLSQQPIGHGGITAQTATWGAYVGGSAKDILAKQGSGERPSDDIRRFLIRMLVKGPVSVAAIKDQATEAGFLWRAVENVRDRLGRMVTTRGDRWAGYTWSMEPGTVEPEREEC